MSRLIRYADMLEALSRGAARRGRRPPASRAAHLRKAAALLRSLTSVESEALLRDGRHPNRLEQLAAEVGFTANECANVFAAAVFNLCEGLRPLTGQSQRPAEPNAAPNAGR